MNSMILFQQLLVLLALMMTGFLAYKTKLIDDGTYEHLSSLMVWILNPFLMVSGVLGKNNSVSGKLIVENMVLVGLLYLFLFLAGILYCSLLRYKNETSYLYRFVMLFPNVGFMGVPLVKEMFGNEYIVLVAFYMLAFNVLCYSYGVYLSSRYGGNTEKFDIQKMISPGMITSILSILIFAFQLQLPSPIVNYVDYLGTTSIALSMMIIGVFMARLDWKSAFAKAEYYIFTVVSMLILPILFVCLIKHLPFNQTAIGVAQIMICMPVASMTCMFTQEYGGDGTEASKLIALTTVCTVITAPLVIWLAG